MKFPDFSTRDNKDYPVSSVYRYGQQSLFILMKILVKNRVRPDSQLFNSWGCNSWGKGMGCPKNEFWSI